VRISGSGNLESAPPADQPKNNLIFAGLFPGESAKPSSDEAARYRGCGVGGWYWMIFAAGCFVVVVLAHICEAYALFPSMGWGLERSTGHFILTCAPRFSASLCFPRVILPGR
jgi:hypothetical protein